MDNNKNAFTLIELLVSIVISVLLLWGIFYFISDTILWISRTTSNADFLKDFTSFASVLNSWNMNVLFDNAEWVNWDVWYLLNASQDAGVLIWVVDRDSLKLAATGSYDQYRPNILWYRLLSESEINSIKSNPSVIYGYSFFWGNTFQKFFVRDFQIEFFNFGDLVDLHLTLFPNFNESQIGQPWSNIDSQDIFKYILTF